MMAKARCKNHGVPQGRKQTYSAQPYLPVGHPRSGVICGRTECRNPAIAWLNLDEERAYKIGQRIFQIDTRAAKIEVQ